MVTKILLQLPKYFYEQNIGKLVTVEQMP